MRTWRQLAHVQLVQGIRILSPGDFQGLFFCTFLVSAFHSSGILLISFLGFIFALYKIISRPLIHYRPSNNWIFSFFGGPAVAAWISCRPWHRLAPRPSSFILLRRHCRLLPGHCSPRPLKALDLLFRHVFAPHPHVYRVQRTRFQVLLSTSHDCVLVFELFGCS